MGSVRNYQRRALEALQPRASHSFWVSFSNEDIYYLDDKRIYFLDVSKGIGTCSDLHGVNIAVFGRKNLNLYRRPGSVQSVFCKWAALLRRPTIKELREEWKNEGVCNVVELIEFIRKEGQNIFFCHTHIKKFYPSII